MKWVLIVLGALVALVLICLAIGALRPRGHVASSRVDLAAGREAVWAVLADFAGWPAWNSAATGMERKPDREGKPVWVVTGGWGDMPYVVDVLEPPARLVTRIPEDAGIGFSGSWTYELEEREGGGSRLTITERGEVSNPLFRFMMIFSDNRATQRKFMRDLAGHLGETVEPVPAG